MEKIPSLTITPTKTHISLATPTAPSSKKKKENENQTMTPLSKCLYKGMKIDPLNRFLEGKINIPYFFIVDLT